MIALFFAKFRVATCMEDSFECSSASDMCCCPLLSLSLLLAEERWAPNLSTTPSPGEVSLAVVDEATASDIAGGCAEATWSPPTLPLTLGVLECCLCLCLLAVVRHELPRELPDKDASPEDEDPFDDELRGRMEPALLEVRLPMLVATWPCSTLAPRP